MSASSPKKVFLSVFLTIVFIGLLGYGFIENNQLNEMQQVLASTQNELTSTQANLSSTKSTLATAETELSQTQDELATTQTDVSNNLNEIDFLDSKLTENIIFLDKLKADYETTSAALATEQALGQTLQSDIDNIEANIDYFTTGFGYLTNDPTYQEYKAFITADTTNYNTYVAGSYDFDDFVLQIKTNALKHKIRCGYVSVRFVGDSGEVELVAFHTTDRGTIYVFPLTDEEVNLQVGYHFYTQCLITNTNYTTSFDDTVGRYSVTW
jgi:hypothetical protein